MRGLHYLTEYVKTPPKYNSCWMLSKKIKISYVPIYVQNMDQVKKGMLLYASGSLKHQKPSTVNEAI